MAILTWDDTGKKLYEAGVDKGVIYPMSDDGTYPKGEAWNGLTAVTESPGGGEETALYANNAKYASLYSKETFGGSIEAYTYPDSFAQCDGSVEVAPGVVAGQQTRKPFGLCYRTLIGNDVKGEDYGYKLTLVYNAKVSPSEKANESIGDSVEAAEMSWDFMTTEVAVTSKTSAGDAIKPLSKIVIDSTKISADKLAALEAKLYGTASDEAQLPSIDEVIALVNVIS